jgi:ABC-type multidrug transport system fused ATPase/permease subunit
VAAPHSDIIILDDPFSAVDGATGNWMFHKGVLEGLKGKTRIVLLNSHLHLLSQFDRVVILDEGRAVAIASPSELLSNYKEIYEKIIGSIGRQHHTVQVEKEEESLRSEMIDHELDQKEKISTNTSPSPLRPIEAVNKVSESGGASADGKLTLTEHRAVGGIALGAYLSYFGSAFWDISNLDTFNQTQISRSYEGYGVILFIIFAFVITQFVRVCIDIELLQWASEGQWKTNSPYLMKYLLLIGLLCLLVDLRTRLQTYFASQTSLNIHELMVRRVLAAPIPTFFDIQTVGSLLNKFGKDMETIDVNIPEFLYQTCLQFFVLLSVVLLCIWSLPLLILFFIPLFSLLVWMARRYSFVSRDLKRLEAISRTPLYSSFTETLTGIETIRAYGVVSRFYSRHLVQMNKYQKFVFTSVMSQIWLTTRMEFGGCLILVGSSVFAVILKEFFEINSTKVGLALVYSLQVTAMLQRNVTLFIELQTYFTSVGECFIPPLHSLSVCLSV